MRIKCVLSETIELSWDHGLISDSAFIPVYSNKNDQTLVFHYVFLS